MYSLLLKTFFRERLSVRRLFGLKIARSKIQSLMMIALLVYAFGVTIVSNVLLNYELAQGLLVVNQIHQLWVNGFAQLTGIGFLFGFFQGQGYLFQYKDFDLLGALPIPQKVITAAKLTMMLIFVYLFASVFILPIYGIWWWFVNPPLWHLFVFIPLFLLAPIPLLLLGSLMSLFIRVLTQRWINAQLFQTLFSVIFMIGFIALTTINPSSWLGWLPTTWLDLIGQNNVIQQWFILGITEYDWFAWIGFIALHLALFIGFILLISGSLLAVNQHRTQTARKTITHSPNKIRSVFNHLVHKEWHRFIGTSIYALNTGFGLILLSIGVIALLFFPTAQQEIMILFSLMNLSSFWAIFMFAGFVLSTVYTPAVSLSLEGKNFALLKSLPIAPMTIVHAKIVFNLWLTVPPMILLMGVSAIVFSFPLLESLLGLIILILMTTFLSIFFMVINLWFPRFDYHHEVEVVKQSLAALIAVLGGFAWVGIFAWFVLGLLGSWSLLGQMIAFIGAQLFLISMSFALLNRFAKTRYPSLTV